MGTDSCRGIALVTLLLGCPANDTHGGEDETGEDPGVALPIDPFDGQGDDPPGEPADGSKNGESGWRLTVRAGRDGNDGKKGPKGERGEQGKSAITFNDGRPY